MKRYIALLRGINISGKNKISMSELKKGLLNWTLKRLPLISTAAMLSFQALRMIQASFPIK